MCSYFVSLGTAWVCPSLWERCQKQVNLIVSSQHEMNLTETETNHVEVGNNSKHKQLTAAQNNLVRLGIGPTENRNELKMIIRVQLGASTSETHGSVCPKTDVVQKQCENLSRACKIPSGFPKGPPTKSFEGQLWERPGTPGPSHVG